MALDLNDRFRQNVIADWLAYFEIVKVKHCLQKKNKHFQQATQQTRRDATPGMLEAVQNPTHLVHKTVLNAMQKVGPAGGIESRSMRKKSGKPKDFRFAMVCHSVRTQMMTPTGLEPVLPA